jgi:hypothetical protein
MRHAFLSFSILFCSIILLAVTGCKKNHSSQPAEDNLRISIDAGSYEFSPASDFNFNLTVESAMPPAGVWIIAEVKAETDNQLYLQAPSIETTNKTTKITLRNLPRQKICISTIKVTSKNTSTNTATTSFRVVYK